MVDAFENANKVQAAEAKLLSSDEHDSLAAKLSREANLLGTGVSSGFMNRASQAIARPGQTAFEFGAAAGLAAGLKVMTDAGGRWGKAAQVLGTVVFVAGGADVANRLINTGSAMADSWSNPGNFDANKETVGRYLGSAFFDYPMLAASAYAGARGVEFGGTLKGASGTKIAAPDLLAVKAADAAAAAEVRFGEIAKVVHDKLRMARLELPSAGYQPMFAADGMPPVGNLKFDVATPKPLRFDASRHPSLLAAEAFPSRLHDPGVSLQLKELNIKPSALDGLIVQKSSISIFPILPLSFLPREEKTFQAQQAAGLRPMELKLDKSVLSREHEETMLSKPLSSFEMMHKDNLKLDYRFQLDNR